METFPNRIDLSELNQFSTALRDEIKKVIIGQDKMIDLSIAALLANGHVLIEGVPGVAKTLMAKLMAKCISVDFSRIQFTPDLMPSDILGTSVFNTQKASFEFRHGPVFSNIVLVDEINRAPAKTQSALFEVMEERQISIDGHTYQMEKPFLAIATQNPIEQEGTYRLPEAQLDRFFFKINADYPGEEEEVQVLMNHHQRKGAVETAETKAVIGKEKLVEFQQKVQEVHIDPKLQHYIAMIARRTRSHAALYLGASPRASIHIMTGSKAIAAMNGRDFVTPEDIKEVVVPVLRHRIILSPEKEMEGISTEELATEIMNSIEVPR